MKIRPKAGARTKSKAKDVATVAVDLVRTERRMLEDMVQEFSDKYPEAADCMHAVEQQQDKVGNLIADAIPLVREAKETIGDFKCSRAWRQAGYDDKKLIEIFGTAEGINLCRALIQEGLITVVKTNRDGLVAYMAHHPDESKVLEDAWEKKIELTAKVTPPKL